MLKDLARFSSKCLKEEIVPSETSLMLLNVKPRVLGYGRKVINYATQHQWVINSQKLSIQFHKYKTQIFLHLKVQLAFRLFFQRQVFLSSFPMSGKLSKAKQVGRSFNLWTWPKTFWWSSEPTSREFQRACQTILEKWADADLQIFLLLEWDNGWTLTVKGGSGLGPGSKPGPYRIVGLALRMTCSSLGPKFGKCP